MMAGVLFQPMLTAQCPGSVFPEILSPSSSRDLNNGRAGSSYVPIQLPNLQSTNEANIDLDTHVRLRGMADPEGLNGFMVVCYFPVWQQGLTGQEDVAGQGNHLPRCVERSAQFKKA